MDSRLLIDTTRIMIVIVGGLTAGYCVQRARRPSPSLGTKVNRSTLAFAQPFVIGLALWSMKTPDWRTLALPLFAATLVIAMWPAAVVIAKLLPMDQKSQGSFVTLAIFSNVGFTYGAFILFVALGAEGAALGALYVASFMPVFCTLGFHISQRYSSGSSQGILRGFVDLARHGHTRNPVLGIVAGLSLNLLHVRAPSVAPLLVEMGIPVTTAAFLFSIGLHLRLSAVKTYWRECALMHVAKFLVSPAIGLGLAAAFGYWQIDSHTLLKVAVIQSATPIAIIAVMLSDVFDLNRDLAGALWLTTNVTAIFLAPVLLLIARAL